MIYWLSIAIREEWGLKILVTNDDGINAEGLWALAKALKQVGEVVVVAPDREQSATGSAVSLHQPVRLNKVEALCPGVKAYSVEGTPADSVILAMKVLFEGELGLVFSGINKGMNLGDDVFLSGTVGGAKQGCFQGLPAVAFSVEFGEETHFEATAKLAVLLARQLSARSLSSGILLNVNLPNLPVEEIRGVEITRLGKRRYSDLIKRGHDGKREYYWIGRGKARWRAEKGTDIWAIRNRKASITPLRSDLTGDLNDLFLLDLADALSHAL